MRRVHTPTVKPSTRPILPGRVEPTWRQAQWPTEADSVKSNFPTRTSEGPGAAQGKIICPLCHAISDGKHWLLDESLYQQLRTDPNVRVQLCPADERIRRQMFDGEVVLRGSWLHGHRDEVLNWVRNEERRARDSNPMARLASVLEKDGQIHILTTSQALARRIGSGLKRAFKGRSTVQRLPYETFTRVKWSRDD